jgi:hypothetical protein
MRQGKGQGLQHLGSRHICLRQLPGQSGLDLVLELSNKNNLLLDGVLTAHSNLLEADGVSKGSSDGKYFGLKLTYEFGLGPAPLGTRET